MKTIVRWEGKEKEKEICECENTPRWKPEKIKKQILSKATSGRESFTRMNRSCFLHRGLQVFWEGRFVLMLVLLRFRGVAGKGCIGGFEKQAHVNANSWRNFFRACRGEGSREVLSTYLSRGLSLSLSIRWKARVWHWRSERFSHIHTHPKWSPGCPETRIPK